MNLKTRINEDFKAAFKAGEKAKKDCLGMLKTEIMKVEKHEDNKGAELTDVQVMEIVSKYNKQLQQTIDQVKDDTNTLVINAKAEQGFIAEYLPKQLNADEIKGICIAVARDVIAPPNQMVGYFMRHFKENYNGQYNPTELKKIVDEIIKG